MKPFTKWINLYLPIILALCVLGNLCATAQAISPLGTDKRDYLFVGMMGFSDAGPRSPCAVEWYQLGADGTLIDQRRLYRTDDTIWGAAIHDRARKDGYLQLVMAVTKQRVHDALLVRVSVDRYGLLGGHVPLIDPRKGGRFSDVILGDLDGNGDSALFATWITNEGDSSIIQWDITDQNTITLDNERVIAHFPGQIIEAITLGRKPFTLEFAVQEDEGCRLMSMTLSNNNNNNNNNHLALNDLGLISNVSIGRVHGLSRDGESLLVAVRRIRFDGEVAIVPEVEYQGEMTGPEVAALDAMQMSQVFRLKPTRNGYGEPQRDQEIQPGRSWATAVSRIPPSNQSETLARIKSVNPNSRSLIYIEGFMGHFFNIDQLESMGFILNKGWVTKRKDGAIPPAFAFKSEMLEQTRAVIMTDTPLWALTYKQILMIKSYVQAGGTLIYCEGPMTGKSGGYNESTFSNLLPTDLGPDFSIVPMPSPQHIDPIGRVRYAKALGPLKPQARVLIQSDDRPLLIERRLGRGRVLQVAALPLGQADDDQPDFWQTESWINWLASWLEQK